MELEDPILLHLPLFLLVAETPTYVRKTPLLLYLLVGETPTEVMLRPGTAVC